MMMFIFADVDVIHSRLAIPSERVDQCKQWCQDACQGEGEGEEVE